MTTSAMSKSGMFGVVCAVLAGLLNFIGGLVLSFVRFGVISKGHHHDFDINKLKALDVPYIQSYWHHRRDMKQYEILSQVFIALAWGLQLVPLLYLTSINTYDRALANAAAGFFLSGTIVAVLDFLLNAGTIQVLDWMTQSFQLNYQDWRALEITYMVSRSRNLWLLTVDWLFMALGLWCIAMFIKRSLPSECRDHLATWANVSILAGVFAFMAFVLDLCRETLTGNWKEISQVLGFFILGLSAVLFPILLFWLSLLMRRLPQPSKVPTLEMNAI